MPFDRTLPYGEVWGHPGGTLYEQGGLLYNSRGRLVHVGPGDVVTEVTITSEAPGVTEEPRDQSDIVDIQTGFQDMETEGVTSDPEPVTTSGRDWRTVTNDELKAQLLIYGLEWRGRAAAISAIKANMEIG